MSATAVPADASAGPPRLWVTLLWIVAFVIANLVANAVGIAAYLFWRHEPALTLLNNVKALENNGPFLAVTEIVSAPLLVIFALLAARTSSRRIADFLGLHWPRGRQVAFGALGLVPLFALDAWLTFGRADTSAVKFAIETYRSSAAEHALPLLFLAFAVAAPLIEEFTFRGFFYSRFSLRLGALPAIVITAVLWAVLHVQYDVVVMGEIFLLGLILGTVRRYSGSLPLAIFLHGAWNAISLGETAYMLSR